MYVVVRCALIIIIIILILIVELISFSQSPRNPDTEGEKIITTMWADAPRGGRPAE